MANKKMTKKDFFLQIKKNYSLTPAEIKFIDHELELLEKKNSKTNKKPTATQTANGDYKTVILDFLKENKDKRYTVTELIKAIDEISELSNQRVSALVKQLRDDFLVERVEEKRKAYFFYIPQVEDLEEEEEVAESDDEEVVAESDDEPVEEEKGGFALEDEEEELPEEPVEDELEEELSEEEMVEMEEELPVEEVVAE